MEEGTWRGCESPGVSGATGTNTQLPPAAFCPCSTWHIQPWGPEGHAVSLGTREISAGCCISPTPSSFSKGQ